MAFRGSVWADRLGRPAPAAVGTGITSVSATAPLVLTLNGSVLTGSIDVSALPTRCRILKSGTLIGVRQSLNFIEGDNVSLDVVDNGANDRVDVRVVVADTTGIGDLDPGRIPRKSVHGSTLIKSPLISPSTGVVQFRGYEFDSNLYTGLAFSSNAAGHAYISALYEDNGMDTNSAITISAGGAFGAGAIDLSSTACLLTGNGLLGNSSIGSYTDGSVALTAGSSSPGNHPALVLSCVTSTPSTPTSLTLTDARLEALAPVISFVGLSTFADNAAATTGGLQAGRVYKTATGELRIVV